MYYYTVAKIRNVLITVVCYDLALVLEGEGNVIVVSETIGWEIQPVSDDEICIDDDVHVERKVIKIWLTVQKVNYNKKVVVNVVSILID